jgi:phage FluMu protein Com
MSVIAPRRILKFAADGTRTFKLKCPRGKVISQGDNPDDHTCVPRSQAVKIKRKLRAVARRLRRDKSRRHKKSILFKRGLARVNMRQRKKSMQIQNV